ncbi:MAG: aldo/keto reductase [Pseudomonadota bacterium]
MTMKYRVLGLSGLRVSELSLGTMTFAGGWPGGDIGANEAKQIFDDYRDIGGNFIDTANMYGQGASESMLADFIQTDRHELVLATKYGMSMGTNDPNAGGMHRKNLVQAVDASLKRLKTDYIDLYWVHAWDRFTPLDEMLRALDDLVKAGKILHIGASNIPAWRVAEANTKANLRGQTPFCALQLSYSLIERTIEHDSIAMAQAFDLGVLAWSPLAGGLLTGKYQNGGGEDGRLKVSPWGDDNFNHRNDAIVAKVVEVAAEIETTPGQVALAWLLAKRAIPIIGGSRKTHFDEALGAVSVKLTPEQIAALDAISIPAPVNPASILPRIDAMYYGEVIERYDA